MAPISATAPLRIAPFRWFFAARSVNLIGNFMAPVALAFAVLKVSDSHIALGAVLAARSIPVIVFLLIGGVIADRLGRARTLFASNLVSGLSQATVAVLLLTGTAQLWHLIVLSIVNGIASAAGLPAQQGLMPQVVPRNLLQEANVLTSFSRAIVAVAAPLTSGLIVITIGAGWSLAIDAATWLVAALLMLPVKVSGQVSAPSIVNDLRSGWDYFRRTTWLWVCVAACCALNAFYEGGLMTLGPVRAKETGLGASGWGLVLTAQGIGVLIMTLTLMRVRLERPLVAGMIGMAVFALPMIALGLRPMMPLILITSFLSGFGIQMFSLSWQVTMQEHVPGALLSRAASYDQLGSFAAVPIGQLAMGSLGAAFGVGNMLLVAGIGSFVVALVTLLSPAVRNLARVVVDAEPNGAAA
ncbi:MAG: MFS transporter [Nocardioides sp.]|nr:MFS transporter [Nocardioides sp.]